MGRASAGFRYTYHARLRMRLREVSEEMVEATVLNPDTTGVGYLGRDLAFKVFADRGTLKVVHVVNGQTIVVVTLIWE